MSKLLPTDEDLRQIMFRRISRTSSLKFLNQLLCTQKGLICPSENEPVFEEPEALPSLGFLQVLLAVLISPRFLRRLEALFLALCRAMQLDQLLHEVLLQAEEHSSRIQQGDRHLSDL